MSLFALQTPTIGAIQLSQCVIQAVPISTRKQQSTGKRDTVDGIAALMQLPGMNGDIARQMQRKKIRSLNGKEFRIVETCKHTILMKLLTHTFRVVLKIF